MTHRRVNQILVGATQGDAITSMALTIRGALRERGESGIYAHFVAPDAVTDVMPLHRLGPGRRKDILVYHASYGAPQVTQVLLRRPERLVIVYHNITPTSFFLEYQPEFAVGLEWGRYELSLLRDRVVLSIADSGFNAAALIQEGFSDVHVVPAGLEPSRLRWVAPDARLAREVTERFPDGFVLGVSQLLTHKRFETMVETMHLLQWVHDLNLGLVVVGAPRLPGYLIALQRHAKMLQVGRVWFMGTASESELATLFRMASVFLSTSAHEGLALPPLEAMSFGLPVVARGAGAITDTVGNAGIVLPERSGPMLLSEAVAEVHRNSTLRSELIARGEARVSEIESEDPAGKFIDLLDTVA